MPGSSLTKPGTNQTSPKRINSQGNITQASALRFLTPIDASLEYHNSKPNEKTSHLMIFSCQFGSYGYVRLFFGATPTGEMFQRKIDKLFRELPNVLVIAYYILIS